MSRRALIVCPGRGTYTPEDLGSLGRRLEIPAVADRALPIVEEADAYRRELGSPTVTELDGAERYSAGRHLEGENAGPLIFACSAVDWAILPKDLYRPVAALGNSMGWYTALHVGGALGFGDALRLVDTMSRSQGGKPLGGQIIVPWVDEDWRPRPERRAEILEVAAGIRAQGHACGVSIELGGYLVLAGDDAALGLLEKRLPAERVGERDYPFRLARHAAFHTALMEEASLFGRERLATLPWSAPTLSLVDGKGRLRRPGIPSAREMFDHTLVEQVVETYDFTASLRVGLREFAPDVVVLLGPGQTLGGAVGQVLCLEGWQGIRSKSEFLARQKGDEPVLISMGRADQFERFVLPHLGA